MVNKPDTMYQLYFTVSLLLIYNTYVFIYMYIIFDIFHLNIEIFAIMGNFLFKSHIILLFQIEVIQ